ncbi:MAG: helix-turn-helix transcriptional regulator [Oscillospiraceae bacterium]|nr:helix-turn-helix transcriptional regulator [Oscillospiraceae bacterium]
MAAKKVGVLIKEARTAAGLSQESLARKIDGVSATDIGKVERGEKDLTQTQLKAIAKVLGVTQKSLLEAPKNISAAAAKKPAATASSAKKTSSSSSAAKKTSSSTAKKTSSSSGTSVKVTATEKRLLELYRAADSETKKAAVSILKGETPAGADILSKLLGGAMEMLGKK